MKARHAAVLATLAGVTLVTLGISLGHTYDVGQAAEEDEAGRKKKAPTLSTDAPRSTNVAIVEPQRQCPLRFLTYGNMKASRHSNHLLSFIGALSFANKLNRTVVLQPPAKGDAGIDQVYDLSMLSRTHCWVTSAEFEKWRKQAANAAVARGCMLMKGTHTDTSQCAATANVGSKLVYKDTIETAEDLRALPVLNVPLTIYLGEMIDQTCFWSAVQPSKPHRAELDRVKLKLFGGKPYVGVHLRNLEKSCHDRAVKNKRVAADGTGRLKKLLFDQCDMSPSYTRRLFADFGLLSADGTVTAPVFLADDQQRPELTKALAGVSYRPEGAFQSGLHPVLIDFWLLVESDWPKSVALLYVRFPSGVTSWKSVH
eukprot:gene15299-23382_t